MAHRLCSDTSCPHTGAKRVNGASPVFVGVCAVGLCPDTLGWLKTH